MKLDIISYSDLINRENSTCLKTIEDALLYKGIIGIQNVPHFEQKLQRYIHASREFSVLHEKVKQKYAPDRNAGKTEGYELGAEWFKDKDEQWQIDDKKASFYAFVPDCSRNQWPAEVNLRTPYLELGQLIFDTGKLLLKQIGLNETVGLAHEKLVGYGRMLHYHKESDVTNSNPDWCGAHTDHGIFTGLVPAFYFYKGRELEEPEEAGLYIVPGGGHAFEKVIVPNKSILLFQVGEFGQLILNDRIKATRHKVVKAKGEVERYTFALFYSPEPNMVIQSKSILKEDLRYVHNQLKDGSISYENWEKASFERYRAS